MKYGKIEDNKLIFFKPYKGGLELNGYVIYNPTKEQYKEAGWYPIVEVPEDGTDKVYYGNLLHYIGYDEGLNRAKNAKIQEIDDYDKSDAVNGFFLGDMTLWVPRETRVSLQNSTAILLKNGIETTTLWEGTMHFDLPCTLLLELLDALEIYALQCFNCTAQHKAIVMNMSSIEEVEKYNYKTGYPEKLTFTI